MTAIIPEKDKFSIMNYSDLTYRKLSGIHASYSQA